MQNKKTIYFKQSIYHSTILKSYRFRLFHSISFSTQALTHICAGAHPRSCITTFLFNKSMLKVCFAAREWIVFSCTPCSGLALPGGTCISCDGILVSKNSGYLQSKYFKFALRQCPKSFNTTIQVWTAAPPPPPSCRPESQHQAKIIK